MLSRARKCVSALLRHLREWLADIAVSTRLRIWRRRLIHIRRSGGFKVEAIGRDRFVRAVGSRGRCRVQIQHTTYTTYTTYTAYTTVAHETARRRARAQTQTARAASSHYVRSEGYSRFGAAVPRTSTSVRLPIVSKLRVFVSRQVARVRVCECVCVFTSDRRPIGLQCPPASPLFPVHRSDQSEWTPG